MCLHGTRDVNFFLALRKVLAIMYHKFSLLKYFISQLYELLGDGLFCLLLTHKGFMCICCAVLMKVLD
ncbi:hypothetical protein FH972_003046 [Carpinus fangiana]|uniref:Uncharacterized protein n=1 Tax=Carpinus fangiana TaxID=176857 RepID=A0A5N6QGT6_9ROSI|nr:hypothetical protein FH972_003046 [Carpinus fangiana]